MSNNIFDINRFGKLTYRKWFHPTNFAWRTVFSFASLPLLFLLFNLMGDSSTVSLGSRYNVLVFLIVLSIVFSPFIFFFNYNHPKKGIIDAMLPASILEKYLVMQLTGIIYAPLLVVVLYGGMDSLLALLFPKVMSGFAVAQFVSLVELNWEKILILFTLQQCILFCNLWFRRNKPLKTFGVIMLFHIILTGIVVGLFFIFIDDMPHMVGVTFNVYEGRGQSLLIKSGDHPSVVIIQLLRIFVDIVMPIGLVIGSYFMLKTKRY